MEIENLCNQLRDATSLVYGLEFQCRSLIQLDRWKMRFGLRKNGLPSNSTIPASKSGRPVW